MEQIVAVYGYLGIFIGTLLEGETVLILAGFLAHRGYLEIPTVIAAAFAGTVAGDQLYFFLGRAKGIPFLETRRAWRDKAERVFSLLNGHQILVIFGFRFLYGMRTVTPFIIGASGIKIRRFLVLNLLGAAIWAIIIGVSGYLFGGVLEMVLKEIKRFEMWVVFIIIAVGFVFWARYFITRGRYSK